MSHLLDQKNRLALSLPLPLLSPPHADEDSKPSATQSYQQEDERGRETTRRQESSSPP